MIRFRLPLTPFGAARSRVGLLNKGPKCRSCGKAQLVRAMTYTDTRYRDWMLQALPFFAAKRPAVPMSGPVGVELILVSPCRKSDHRKRTPAPEAWDDTKPDLDNLLKPILDCCEKVGILENDAQVCKASLEKIRAAQGEDPCIMLAIYQLEARASTPADAGAPKESQLDLPCVAKPAAAEEWPWDEDVVPF